MSTSVWFGRSAEGGRSEVESLSESVLIKIVVVVDLHFLLDIELALDTTLEILKGKLLLHGGAVVRRVANEDTLD